MGVDGTASEKSEEECVEMNIGCSHALHEGVDGSPRERLGALRQVSSEPDLGLAPNFDRVAVNRLEAKEILRFRLDFRPRGQGQSELEFRKGLFGELAKVERILGREQR